MTQNHLNFKSTDSKSKSLRNEDLFSIIRKRKDDQEDLPLELVNQLLGESLKLFFPVKALIESSGINSNFDDQIKKVFSDSIVYFSVDHNNHSKLSVAGISGDFPTTYLNNIAQYVQNNNIRFRMGVLDRLSQPDHANNKPDVELSNVLELVKRCNQIEVLQYKTLYDLFKFKQLDLFSLVEILTLNSQGINDDISVFEKLVNLKKLIINDGFKFPKRTIQYLRAIPKIKLISIVIYDFEETIQYSEYSVGLLDVLYELSARKHDLIKILFRSGKTGVHSPIAPCFKNITNYIEVLGIRFENGITNLDELIHYQNLKCLEIVCEETGFADDIVVLDLPQINLKKLRIIGGSNIISCNFSRLIKLQELTFISCLIDRKSFETLPRNLKKISLINSLIPETERGMTVPFKLPDTIEFLNINGYAPPLYKHEIVEGEGYPISQINQKYLRHSHPIPDISNLKQLKGLLELNLNYSLRVTVNKLLKNIPASLKKLSLNWIGEDITWIKNDSMINPINVTVPVNACGKAAWYTVEKFGFRMTFAIPLSQMSIIVNSLNLKITEDCKKILTKLTFPKRRKLKVEFFKKLLEENQASHVYLRINVEINNSILSKVEDETHYNLPIDNLITPNMKELHIELCDDNSSLTKDVWIQSEVPSTLKVFTINNICQNTKVTLDVPHLNITQTKFGYGYIDVIATTNSRDNKSKVIFSQSKSVKRVKLGNSWV